MLITFPKHITGVKFGWGRRGHRRFSQKPWFVLFFFKAFPNGYLQNLVRINFWNGVWQSGTKCCCLLPKFPFEVPDYVFIRIQRNYLNIQIYQADYFDLIQQFHSLHLQARVLYIFFFISNFFQARGGSYRDPFCPNPRQSENSALKLHQPDQLAEQVIQGVHHHCLDESLLAGTEMRELHQESQPTTGSPTQAFTSPVYQVVTH